MKSRILLILSALTLLAGLMNLKSQEIKNFPFDPYAILKTWNYDFLIKTMGNGEEIIVSGKNQTYIAGLRYPSDLLGMHGKLEFSFVKDSISRFQFRQEHEIRVTSADMVGGKTRDPTINSENRRAILKLDSIQKRDSLSRDSVVRAISEILGKPLSFGRTAVTEKNARYSAIWTNRGYTCLYKDYIDYSEIVFSLSKVPSWAVGEFDIPAGSEILRKMTVNTRKMSWTASLLGFPSDASKMIYVDVFLLLEFNPGQRYLVSVPKNAIGYLQTSLFLEFATGSRFLVSVPKNSIGFLPSITFEDCNGDAIPEAWIQIPSDTNGIQTRHYIYSLELKDPNLIFSSDDLIPADISIQGTTRIKVTFQDGTTRLAETQDPIALPRQTAPINPKGFRYLHSTKLNTDGSTNFIGGIELGPSKGSSANAILEITYKHSGGGWEPDQIRLLPLNK